MRPEKSAEKKMRTTIITYSTPEGTLDTHVFSGSHVGRDEEEEDEEVAFVKAAISGRSAVDVSSSDVDSQACADRKYRGVELRLVTKVKESD